MVAAGKIFVRPLVCHNKAQKKRSIPEALSSGTPPPWKSHGERRPPHYIVVCFPLGQGQRENLMGGAGGLVTPQEYVTRI